LKTEETQFPFLLKEILGKTQIERIRISSLGPEYLNDAFFDVIQDPRILPHFHLSIQSFADPVLQAMKRNYSAADLDRVLKQFSNIKSSVPVSLGADIIVGFPGETEEDFQETMNGVLKYKITKLHAFPFSAHTQGQTIPASTFADQIS
jgi:tRNA A37 methylthiotransferase MiaB